MKKPVRAKKSLGQNFLVDANYQRRIIEALELRPADDLVEIGPGTGALTQHLVGATRRLTAIELDDRLAAALHEEYRGRSDFRLLHQDVMTVDVAVFAHAKVVGNIPYNITSLLLFRLLERAARPAVAVLMVQKEVADRIVAAPGTSAYGALTVGVAAVAAAERLLVVPRGAFRPVPGVDSAVVRILPHDPPVLTEPEEDDLRTLTRAAFSWRRKQLQNTLRHAAGYGLAASDLALVEARTGIAPTARPEEIAPDQFIRLARVLRQLGRPDRPTPS